MAGTVVEYQLAWADLAFGEGGLGAFRACRVCEKPLIREVDKSLLDELSVRPDRPPLKVTARYWMPRIVGELERSERFAGNSESMQTVGQLACTVSVQGS